MHLIEVDTTSAHGIGLLEQYADLKILPRLPKAGIGLIDDTGNLVEVFLVIDGQQRLTTLLALFRQWSPGWTSPSITINGTPYPKLIAGSPAEDAAIRSELGLSALPMTIATTPAADRIRDAFAQVRTRASSIPPTVIPVLFLQAQTKVLGVCLDQSHALGLFLTLNDRGLALTTLEKLKAHCMYLDSLAAVPSPHTVHTAFGALYRTLDNSNSLITDDQAVQIATLFHINGVFPKKDVVWWSAEQCFKEVLSDSTYLNIGNLNQFLQGITDIVDANNALAAALTPPTPAPALALAPPTTRDIFYLALEQRRLSHRGLAIIMRFHAQYPATRSNLGLPTTTIALPSNVDIADHLTAQLAFLSANGCGLPAYQAQIQNDINALRVVSSRQVSVLDLAVMVDICGTRPATFLDTWTRAFAPGTTLQNGFVQWADYLNWWNGRIRYLRDLLDTGDCGKHSLRYQIALRKEADLGRYWGGLKDSVEHVFPVVVPGTYAMYGFVHPAAYQAFCQTLGNIVPLRKGLNKSLKNNPPHVKSSHYQNQTTLHHGRSVIPHGFPSPSAYSPSAVQLGNGLLGLSPPGNPIDYRDFIRLRNIEMVCFAATVL